MATPASRAATTREPRSSPRSAVRPTKGSSCAEPGPVGRDDVAPDVVGIPLQPLPYAGQLARVVDEDLARR